MKKGQQKVLIFAFAAVVALGGIALAPFASAQDSQAQTKLSNDFQKAQEIVRQNYVVELDHETLTKAAIQGMLKSLDPHSDYMDSKTFQEFKEKQQSEYYGIGAQIGVRNRATYVIEPFKRSPAARAGLRYGDHIVAVNGEDTSSWASDRVRNVLVGPRGTEVTVTVKRPGVDEPITMTITRDAISYPSIPNYYLVKPGVGYIGLTRNFQATTNEELTRAMAALREKGAESFILDLRGNGGGYLEQAIRVADRLLQRGQTIVSTRGRPGRGFDQDEIAQIGAFENFPLVVLTDRRSASASEIVAGAIQDHDRGLIIGETTFGKGLVQRIFQIPTISGPVALTLTIARYYTPSGRLIQRDYSNGSLFEYYSRRSGLSDVAPPRNSADEKKTDLGRTVYGGGGIEPDIKVDPVNFLTLEFFTTAQQRMFTGVFMFVRELINGQIAGHSEFKINGIEYDHRLAPNEFLVTDGVLNSFRAFAAKYYKDNPDHGVTPAMIEDNIVWLRARIRYEALQAAYGSDKADQGLADLDLQLQRAVAEMPNAAELARRSWRQNTANTRPGGGGRPNQK
ncbi:MAG TPA: S41 family peptidase [Blastocatellia bacterium]|nr:S41 family peptidase [Blastocatellia bacterium]